MAYAQTAPAYVPVAGFSIPAMNPAAGLVSDGAGNFWGTAPNGGAFNYGTVFKINMATGAIATVIDFDGVTADNSRGANPAAGLVSDGAGNLWGTTSAGGVNDEGTVFKINVATGAITTVIDFDGSNSPTDNSRGAKPAAGLVSDGTGNLWGTTSAGGVDDEGTVFKIKVAAGFITTVIDFDGSNSSTDNSRGASPEAGLVSDGAGNLWGTTSGGGVNDDGTVFEINVATSAIATVVDMGSGSGYSPAGGLVSDGAGNFWGTTSGGGVNDDGTVFKINVATGAISTVTYFDGSTSTTDSSRGASPVAGLVSDGAGNLWGTTSAGGVNDDGTVFKINVATGAITTVIDFDGSKSTTDNSRGAMPEAGLVNDGAGNLWGMTSNGGAAGNGTVFKINVATSAITTVSDIGSGPGFNPDGGLVSDGAGNLWGTMVNGGVTGNGTVFKISLTTDTITTVIDFDGSNSPTDNSRGYGPGGGLVSDGAANLWGTTAFGGVLGGGTVFKIDVATGAITTAVDFGSSNLPTDNSRGARPEAALVSDGAGNLWGTTSAGGVNDDGTVFKINVATGAITTVIDFDGSNSTTDNSRGSDPEAGLVNDGAGNLWGTTFNGGAAGDGTVFKIDVATGGIATVVDFDGSTSTSDNIRGVNPEAALVSDGAGNLWGATSGGGVNGDGTVFQINMTTGAITTVVDFDSSTSTSDNSRGVNPEAALVSDGAGNLWGTTSGGGVNGDGTVFQINVATGAITTVIDFTGNAGSVPGATPTASLLLYNGNLWGTASSGGVTSSGQPAGGGEIFYISLGVISYTMTPSAGTGGSISPNTAQTVTSGSSVTFTATPNSGYAVNQWLVNGSVAQTGGTTFTLNNVTANDAVEVTFTATAQTYTVTPSAGTGGGISPNTAQTVTSGSSVTFTATPNSGYTVNQWLVNGSVAQTGGTTYTLGNVTGDEAVEVTFAVAPLPVSVPNFSFELPSVANGSWTTGYNGDTTAVSDWTIAAQGGWDGGVQNTPNVYLESSGSLPAPADGLQFAYLNDDGGDTSSLTSSDLGAASPNSVYTLTVALGRRLDVDSGIYTVQLLLGGTPVATGTLSGLSIPQGTFQDLSVSYTTPSTVSGDLQIVLTHAGIASNSNLQQGNFDNVRLTEVSASSSYAVTPSAGTGGSISPNTAQTVSSGGSIGFTATPNTGYVVNQWLVNGSVAQTEGTTFTLNNVTANATVEVTFTSSAQTYTVTPSAGTGGNISPNTDQTVTSGGSVAFTAAPDSGYTVNQWLVNGSVAQTGGTTFTLNTIVADASVQVTFQSVTTSTTPSQIVTFSGRKQAIVTGFTKPVVDSYGLTLVPGIDPGYFGDFSFDANGNLLYKPGPGFTGYDQANYSLTSAKTTILGQVLLFGTNSYYSAAIRSIPNDGTVPIVLKRGLPATVWLQVEQLPIFPKSGFALLTTGTGSTGQTIRLGHVSRRGTDPRGMLRFPVSTKAPLGPGVVTIQSSAGAFVTSFNVNIIDKNSPTVSVNLNANDSYLGSLHFPKNLTVSLYGTRSNGSFDQLLLAQITGPRLRASLFFDSSGQPARLAIGKTIINLSGTATQAAAFALASASAATDMATQADTVAQTTASQSSSQVQIIVHATDGSPIEGASLNLYVWPGTESPVVIPVTEIGNGEYAATVPSIYSYDPSPQFDACSVFASASEAIAEFGDAIPGAVGTILKSCNMGEDAFPQLLQDVCNATTGNVIRVFNGNQKAYVTVTGVPGLKAAYTSKVQLIQPFTAPPEFDITLNLPAPPVKSSLYEGFFSTLSTPIIISDAGNVGPADVSGSVEVTYDPATDSYTVEPGWDIAGLDDYSGQTVINGRLPTTISCSIPCVDDDSGTQSSNANISISYNAATDSYTGTVFLQSAYPFDQIIDTTVSVNLTRH